MGVIMYGKELMASLSADIAKRAGVLARRGLTPRLDIILVGGDEASVLYASRKQRDCEKLGIKTKLHSLSSLTTEEELIALIEALNSDEKISAIMLELPLPRGLDSQKVAAFISPKKDVDAVGPMSAGRLMHGEHGFVPCAPAAAMLLLDEYGIDCAGKEAVVIGRSNIGGKPAALLLLERDATVTICHSKTKNLKAICQRADILFVAIGRPSFITGDMIKEGACVIDIGINYEGGKICGDVDFSGASQKASFITPVPGGVGGVTRMLLLLNVIKATEENL